MSNQDDEIKTGTNMSFDPYRPEELLIDKMDKDEMNRMALAPFLPRSPVIDALIKQDIDEGVGSYQPWGKSRLQQAREELNDVEFAGLLKNLQDAPFIIDDGG